MMQRKQGSKAKNSKLLEKKYSEKCILLHYGSIHMVNCKHNTRYANTVKIRRPKLNLCASGFTDSE